MRSPRHLSSPVEVAAALSDTAPEEGAISLHLSDWSELQLVQLHFHGAGKCEIAPIAFHAVSTFTGSASYMSEEGNGYRHPLHLPAGATCFRGASTGARYVWTAPHEASITCLDPELVRRSALETGLANPDRIEIENAFQERDPVCAHLVHALEAEAQIGPYAAQSLVVQSIASALASRILARHNTLGARDKPLHGGLGIRTLRRVRAYIEEHVGEPISLDDLARVAGVSRFHFARMFRVSTGESPMGFLLRARIERGKARLKERDVSVSRLATELGFADQSHFTRTFRRLVGTSPKRFARLQDDAKS